MSVEINPSYQEEIKKYEAGGAAENKEIEAAQSSAQVTDLLKEMRTQEMMKGLSGVAEIDTERNARIEEINGYLKEISTGEIGEAKEFFKKSALETAKNYGISAENMEELRDRLAEARVQIEEDIREATERYKQADLNKDVNDSESILEFQTAKQKLEDLLLKQKQNFQNIQKFINAAEALEK